MVEILKIVGAHGVQGAVRAILYSDNIKKYKTLYDNSGQVFQFRVLKYLKESKCCVIALEGVSDRNAAEALSGTKLYVPRDHLPRLDKNEFYVHDLIGRDVKIVNSQKTCRIISVQNFGASDLIELRDENGNDFYIPFTKENFLGSSVEDMKISHEAIEMYKWS